MRYHYKTPPACCPVYGEVYICNHPVYSKCTLFKEGDKGLAVIQQRYSITTKRTWWTQIDDYFRNPIYIHPKFRAYFEKMAGPCKDGLYPTVTIRQLMWALKMKPLRREIWETCFDHSPI
jgi:hypothetical protein